MISPKAGQGMNVSLQDSELSHIPGSVPIDFTNFWQHITLAGK